MGFGFGFFLLYLKVSYVMWGVYSIFLGRYGGDIIIINIKAG